MLLQKDDTIQGTKVKTLQCHKLGDPTHDPSVFRVTLEDPKPCPPHCVRIRTMASSVNFADLLQVQGLYQERKMPPFVPGAEVSGVISEVGTDVRGGRFNVGDCVCALTSGGAFSEEVFAPAASTVRVPRTCDVEAAAGLPVAFGTAYMGLVQRVNISHGQWVLITGAAGGVGLAAVQIARGMGARVIALVRGEEKMRMVKDLGAEVCIDTSTLGKNNDRKNSDVKNIVRQYTKNGVDVVFDPVGLPEAVSLLRWGGHVVVVGFASGKIPKYPGNIILVKNITVHGLYWGKHLETNPTMFRESLEAVADMYARGDVVVNVSHRYSFEQWQEAFSVLKNRQVVGKLLFCAHPKSML